MSAARNPPRKQPHQARAQETVRAILQAGTYILIEQGHDRATTNAIADRAGVNISSLYQYFPNKQSIFTAIADEHFRGHAAHMAKASLDSFDAPLARSLKIMIRAHVSFCVTHGELARALLLFAHGEGRTDMIATTRRELSRAFATYLATRARSELRPRNATRAAHVTILVADALTQDALLSAEPLHERALTAAIADVLEPYLVARRLKR